MKMIKGARNWLALGQHLVPFFFWCSFRGHNSLRCNYTLEEAANLIISLPRNKEAPNEVGANCSQSENIRLVGIYLWIRKVFAKLVPHQHPA